MVDWCHHGHVPNPLFFSPKSTYIQKLAPSKNLFVYHFVSRLCLSDWVYYGVFSFIGLSESKGMLCIYNIYIYNIYIFDYVKRGVV